MRIFLVFTRRNVEIQVATVTEIITSSASGQLRCPTLIFQVGQDRTMTFIACQTWDDLDVLVTSSLKDSSSPAMVNAGKAPAYKAAEVALGFALSHLNSAVLHSNHWRETVSENMIYMGRWWLLSIYMIILCICNYMYDWICSIGNLFMAEDLW